MKCIDCGREILVEEEMNRCPTCKKFTLRRIEGVVITDPEFAENMNGEQFVYFTIKTDDREVTVEVKQGFETNAPVQKGDEVVVECAKLNERIQALRVYKLENKRLRTLFNYKGGCLLPVVGILITMMSIYLVL